MSFKPTTDYIINDVNLMDEWDWNKNAERGLDPKNITRGSHIYAWWKCKDGHSYNTMVYCKTSSHATKCPICNGKQILKGFNDLQTTYPLLATQWHPTKNGNLTPNMVTTYSNKKVWWQCTFGHEWESTVANRVNGRDCPICSKEMRTSFPEQAILFYFNQVTNVQNRVIVCGKEIDVYLPTYKIGIEYNGMYWHRDKHESDDRKVKYLAANGIRIISVHESDVNQIQENKISYIYNQALDWCIVSLFELIGINNDNVIDTKRDRFQIYDQYISLKKENSFGENYPQLVEEWMCEKNGNLTPYMVSQHSNKIVWWKCSKCGYEWEAMVNSRSNGSGCVKCGHEKRKKARYIMIYCKELNRIFNGVRNAANQLGVLRNSISMCLTNKSQYAGKHPVTLEELHWYYVYDTKQKDGNIIYGALSLGYITQEDVELYLTTQN